MALSPNEASEQNPEHHESSSVHEDRPGRALLEILQSDVDELQAHRKNESESMIRAGLTLQEILNQIDND